MDKGLISGCEDCHFRQAFYSNEHDTLKEALEAQIIEYESRGQVLYAGLGAPSSIRLVYDLLGKDKPTDLPPIKNERMDTLKAKEKLLDEFIADLEVIVTKPGLPHSEVVRRTTTLAKDYWEVK